MAVPTPAVVLSHWYSLLESFQMPPLELYTAIEEAVKRRQVPNIEISRVDWNEGGVFSAKREYLRIARGRHVFDICGAPFGTGFFVSSWLVRPQSAPWPVAVLLLAMGAFFVFFVFMKIFGAFLGIPAFMIGFPLIFWGFVQFMNTQSEGWDDSIVAIPIFGAIYERIFRPETYYRTDTILMFQQSVHNAVLEVVDHVSRANGVRALSELERQPAMSRLSKAAGR